MPSHNVYFYQSGSIPGIGMFPAGIIVEVDDATNAVLSQSPLALPTSPLPPEAETAQPTTEQPAASPSPSSSRQATKAPALSPEEHGD